MKKKVEAYFLHKLSILYSHGHNSFIITTITFCSDDIHSKPVLHIFYYGSFVPNVQIIYETYVSNTAPAALLKNITNIFAGKVVILLNLPGSLLLPLNLKLV